MPLPEFGKPIIRACPHCNVSIYFKSWTDRCQHCKRLVVPPEGLLALEEGIKVEVTEDGHGLVIRLPTDEK